MAYIGRDITSLSNAAILDDITFSSSAGPYNLTKSTVAFTPISAQALVISIDGVIQDPGSYTISGSTVTFDTSISSSCTNDFIVHNGVGIVNEVSDGAVTTAKLGTDAVTTAKILDNNVTVAKLPTTLDISGNTVTLPASVSGLGTGITASQLTSTLDISSKTITLPASVSGLGTGITNAQLAGSIDVTSKITGVVPSANLGSGTASSSTILYGDSTYKAEPGGGKVLQIVQMAKTDTTSINGTSYGDITGLSLAITPTAASSKILLTGNINYGFQNDGWLKFQVDIDGAGYNDVTGYMGAAASNRQVGAFGVFQAAGTAGWSPMFLHTPSYTLTDVLTYKIQGIVSNGTYPFYINRTWTDTDSTGYGRTATTLTFMEIAA